MGNMRRTRSQPKPPDSKTLAETGKEEKQKKKEQGKPKTRTWDFQPVDPAKYWADRFQVPPEVGLRPPNDGERSHAPPPGYAAIYIQHYRHGLTLPLPPFVAAVLSHHRIALAQIHPDRISNLVQFLKKCEAVSVVPTVGLFRHFFRLGRKHEAGKDWYEFNPIGQIEFNPTKRTSLHGSNREPPYLFFKTENSPVWNDSPVMDPPLADDEKPSALAVNKLVECNSAEFEGYSDKELEDDEEDLIPLSELPRRKRLKTTEPANTQDAVTPESQECNAKTLSVPRLEDTAPDEQFAFHFQKCESAFSQVKKDKDDLQKMVDSQQKELKEKEVEVASLLADKDRLQKVVDSQQKELKEKEVAIASLLGDKDHLQKLLKEKEDTIASVQMENDALKSKVSKLQDVVDSSRVDLQKVLQKML